MRTYFIREFYITLCVIIKNEKRGPFTSLLDGMLEMKRVVGYKREFPYNMYFCILQEVVIVLEQAVDTRKVDVDPMLYGLFRLLIHKWDLVDLFRKEDIV